MGAIVGLAIGAVVLKWIAPLFLEEVRFSFSAADDLIVMFSSFQSVCK